MTASVVAVALIAPFALGNSAADAGPPVTITVGHTADDDPAGACTNPGVTTPLTGVGLREATCIANNITANDPTTPVTIDVPSGTYVLTQALAPGDGLQLGTAVGANISLVGSGAATTTIEGDGVHRVLDVDPGTLGGITVLVQGVTLTGGHGDDFGGGGIIAGSAGVGPTGDALAVNASVITANAANGGTNTPGGGIQLIGGHLTITDSTISDNNANESNGGGIAYQSAADSSTPGFPQPEGLTITGSTISGNTVSNNSGVGNGGAGLAVSSGDPSVVYDVSATTFEANTVTGTSSQARGAAIWSQSGALTVTRSTFTANSVGASATSAGGAVEVSSGSAGLTFNRIVGNTAHTGSGVDEAGGTVTANDNWWGCNAGPNSAGCDGLSGTSASTWLVFTATANPTSIGASGSSTISAGVTTDSGNAAIPAGSLTAFVGLTVAWSGALPAGATLSAVSSTIGAAGTATVTYSPNGHAGAGQVTAALDNATATASISVQASPAFTSADHVTFTVGALGDFTITTSGSPAPSISLTPGLLPAGVSFTDNGNGTATLTGTPTAGAGTHPFTLTASNGINPDAVQAFTLTVDQAPTISSANTQTFLVGTAGSFTITTTGFPTASVTETGPLPTGVGFTNNGDGTATIAGTPAVGAGGPYPLTLTASNGVLPDATQSFTLTVDEAPSVTAQPTSQTVAPGATATFAAAAGGFPAPTVQWQISTDGGTTFSNIAGATSVSLTFTATLAESGNEYRAVFTNSISSVTTTAATLTVGTQPAFTSAAATTFTVGAAGTFAVTTSGAPAAAITATGAPVWLTVTDNHDGTATLGGTPPTGSGGVFTFTLHAANTIPPPASQLFTLTVLEAPTISSSAQTTFSVGVVGSFTVTTGHSFPAAAALTATGTLPTGVTFTDNGDGTATLAGLPAAGAGGSYPLTITASNGVAPDAVQAFTLNVDESPSITSAATTTFAVGKAGTFTVQTAPGVPATTILTESGALPSGVTFTDNGDGTATLAGTPAAGTTGSYPLTLTAGNGGAPAVQSFILTVTGPAVVPLPPTPPASSGVLGGVPSTTTPGEQLTVTGSGFAPFAPVAFGIYSSPTSLGSAFADATGAVSASVTIPQDFSGPHTLVAAGTGANSAPRFLSASTTVEVAPAVPATPVVPSEPLASTGPAIDVPLALLAGTLLLVVGGGLWLIGRPRRLFRQSC